MIAIHEYVKAKLDQNDELKRIIVTCRYCKKDLLKVVDIELVIEEIEIKVCEYYRTISSSKVLTDDILKLIVGQIAQHANNKIWHNLDWAYGYKAAIDDILEMLGEKVDR